MRKKPKIEVIEVGDTEEVDNENCYPHTGIGHPLSQSTTLQSELALTPRETSRANNPLGQHSTLQGMLASHSETKFTFSTQSKPNLCNGQLPTLHCRMATIGMEKYVAEEKEVDVVKEEDIANAIANEIIDSNGELGLREPSKSTVLDLNKSKSDSNHKSIKGTQAKEAADSNGEINPNEMIDSNGDSKEVGPKVSNINIDVKGDAKDPISTVSNASDIVTMIKGDKSVNQSVNKINKILSNGKTDKIVKRSINNINKVLSISKTEHQDSESDSNGAIGKYEHQDSECDSNGTIGLSKSVLPPVIETGGIQKMISTVPDASEMLTGIKGEMPMILADSNDKLNFNRFDDQRKADSTSEVDVESVTFEARNVTKVSPGINVTPGPSNSVKDIDLVRHLPSKKQIKICSTNEK